MRGVTPGPKGSATWPTGRSFDIRVRLLVRRIRRTLARIFRRRKTIEEQNIWNLYLEVAWYGVLSGVASTFVSVFAVRLGASNTAMGFLSSLPALVYVLWLIPSARLIERQRRQMTIVVWAGFFERFGYFLVALLPFCTRRVEALIALVALITLPAATSSLAFTSMMGDVVPIEKRVHVVSIRNVLVSSVSMATELIGGKLLDILLFPLNYQLLFSAGFLTSLVSLRYLRRVQAPDIVVTRSLAGNRLDSSSIQCERARQVEHRTRAPGLPIVRLRRFIGEVIGQRDFVRFAFSAFIFHWGLYLPAALYPIYRVRELGASDSWVGLLAMAQSATTVVTYFLWGKVAVRQGNRSVLWISSLGMMLFPVLTGLSPMVEHLLFVSIVGGIFGGGFNLSLFNTMLEVCPQERRPSYVAIHTTLINVAAFLAPLLGVCLASALTIRAALFIAGLGRILGAFLFYALLVTHSLA